MTHDLLKNILEQVGVEIDKVLVSDLKGSTYYARIHLSNGGKVVEVDSRPSDAIALALRFHRPIFVERALFESMPAEGTNPAGSERKLGNPVSTTFLGMTVQDLTDDLIVYFDLSDAQGVLVSEVEDETGAGRLQRGDVVLAVEGEPVRNVVELRHKLVREKGRVVTLHIRRDGRNVDVPLSVTQTETPQLQEETE
jgi:S1-C subfamily serine protease